MYICRGLHTGHLRQQQQQRQRQMRRFDKALPLVAVTVACLLLAVLGRAAMCLNRTESHTLLRDVAADPANPAPSPRASHIHPPLAPRVALLFLLSQPQLPTEPAWTAFFEAAARLPRPQTRQRGGTVTVATAAAAAAAAAAATTVEDTIGRGRRLHPPLPALMSASYPGYLAQHGLEISKSINLHRGLAGAVASSGTSSQLQAPQTDQQHQEWQTWTAAEALAAQHPTMVPGPQPGPHHRHPLLAAAAWMFSVYVHTPPGMTLPPGSLLAGSELPDPRINTSHGYGQHVLAEAELLLLGVALRDSAASYFVLLSDESVPLHPPEVVWAQLTGSTISRLDACTSHGRDTQFSARWRPGMATAHFTAAHWRKSSQWFGLTRRHALLTVADSHVRELFARHCWTDVPAGRAAACVSDEHLLPSLLASYGLDSSTEVDCEGLTHFADWRRGGWHPYSFTAADVTPALLYYMRNGGPRGSEAAAAAAAAGRPPPACDAAAAAASARLLVWALAGRAHTPLKDGGGANAATAVAKISTIRHQSSSNHSWLVDTGLSINMLEPSCPLFARKFPATAMPTVLPLLLSCTGVGLGAWCDI